MGLVAASAPKADRPPGAEPYLTGLLGKSTGGAFRDAPAMTINAPGKAIQVALSDEGAAALITAIPTSKGFRASF